MKKAKKQSIKDSGAAAETAAAKAASKPAKKGSAAKVEKYSIKKQYTDNKSECRATFTLPKQAAPGAKSVYLVGDFNSWNETATPMKAAKNGDYSATVELQAGAEYRFKYLIDGSRWENDWCADKYVKNPHGGEDSVVAV